MSSRPGNPHFAKKKSTGRPGGKPSQFKGKGPARDNRGDKPSFGGKKDFKDKRIGRTRDGEGKPFGKPHGHSFAGKPAYENQTTRPPRRNAEDNRPEFTDKPATDFGREAPREAKPYAKQDNYPRHGNNDKPGGYQKNDNFGKKNNYNKKEKYGKGKPTRFDKSNAVTESEPTISKDAKTIRFDELPLDPATQLAIEAMGFVEATPIQGATIPLLLEGKDVIGQAQTGTGKTAAFGIPLIEAARKGKRGLVLAPTRELAKQVQQELQALAHGSPVEAVCIVGGASYRDQLRALERHPKAIVVATPGRVVDHLSSGNMDLSDIELFVLDEADEMMSMGFKDELDAIVQALPAERQNVMFSATMPKTVEALAKKTLTNPETVRAARGPATSVKQMFVQVAGRDRLDAVTRILAAEEPTSTLLFCKTRARVDELVESLRGIGALALHGGMQQPAREATMRRFREGQTPLLIATDVAARGLDVDTVELVLHDDIPGDVDTYIHRMGRTGRAGRTGMSIMMIGPRKQIRMREIQKVAGEMERYEVPGDEALFAARGRRLIESLQEVKPTKGAWDMLKEARQHFTDDELLARLLEDAVSTPTMEAPEASGTVAVALKVGKMDNVHPGSLVGVLTNAGGLRGEDVGRIDILEKMSVVEVPAKEADRVCESLQRARLSGRPLLPRIAEDWGFKAAFRN